MAFSVNCIEERALCDQLDVSSYPTIRLYEGGSLVRYRGPRKEDS